MTNQFIETRGSTPEERRPFRMLVTQQSVQVVHLGVSIGFLCNLLTMKIFPMVVFVLLSLGSAENGEGKD